MKPVLRLLTVLLFALSAAQLSAAPAARPNIVFILVDDLGFASVLRGSGHLEGECRWGQGVHCSRRPAPEQGTHMIPWRGRPPPVVDQKAGDFRAAVAGFVMTPSGCP